MHNKTTQTIGFFLLTILAFIGPVFFGYVLYPTGEDLVSYYYPMFDFYSRALHAGQSFLWLPYIYSGFPVYTSQVGGFFDPLNLFLFRLFSTDVGIHTRLATDLLLVSWFSYLAARALGISRRAATLVGPSYLLAFHWRFLSNPVIANTLFLLPLLIFSVSRAFLTEKIAWKYVLLAGVGLGWALLGGYTQLVVYAILLTGMFVLGRMYLERWHFARIGASLGAGLCIALLGVCIALPQILPAKAFLSFTTRAEPATYAQLTLKTITPGDLLMVFVPDYFYVPYVAEGKRPVFIGALWFLLGLGGLVLTLIPLIKHVPPNRDVRQFAPVAFAFIFAFVAALKWSPLYVLLNKIPVLDMFRFPFRFMFLGTFLLSLLAGFAFDRAGELAHSRAFRYVTYLFAGIATTFVCGISLMQFLAVNGRGFISGALYFVFSTLLQGKFGFLKGTAHYQDAIDRGLDAYHELLSLSDMHILTPLLLLVVGVVMAVMLVRGKISPERFKRVGTVVIGVTILAVASLGWHNFVPSGVWQYPDTLAQLGVKDAAYYRIYSFLPGEAANPFIPPQYKISDVEEKALGELQRASSLSNGNVLIFSRSIDGYDQFEPADTLGAVGLAGGELAAGYGAGTTDERREKLLNNLQLVGMMGGKYIISGVKLSSPYLKPLGVPVVSSFSIPFFVYENQFALPRYYFAGVSESVPHTSFSDLMSHANVHIGSAVYLDCTGCAVPQTKMRVIRSVEEKNGSFVFHLATDATQYLVVSETNLPGWVATIDGKPTDIVRANGLFMAVRVEKGEHIVRLEYHGMLDELATLRNLGIVK